MVTGSEDPLECYLHSGFEYKLSKIYFREQRHALKSNDYFLLEKRLHGREIVCSLLLNEVPFDSGGHFESGLSRRSP